MRKVSVINGPNLDLLGVREPGIYGKLSLQDIRNRLEDEAKGYNIELDFYQSNHEGDIIEKIHEAYKINMMALS